MQIIRYIFDAFRISAAFQIFHLQRCISGRLFCAMLLQKVNYLIRCIGNNSFVVMFCRETNVHGFNHVANRNHYRFERYLTSKIKQNHYLKKKILLFSVELDGWH